MTTPTPDEPEATDETTSEFLADHLGLIQEATRHITPDYVQDRLQQITEARPDAQPQSNSFPLGNSCPAPTLGDDMTWTQRTFMTAVIAAIVGVAALMGWTAWTASQHTKPASPPPPAVVIPADM